MVDGPLEQPAFKSEGTMLVTEMKRAHVMQPEDRHVARRPKDVFLIDGDMLNVYNEDTKPIVFRWARKNYRVNPGEEKFVIFEAVVNALGDPRSMEGSIVKYDDGDGMRGQVPMRYDELCRLFALYGVREENIADLVAVAPKVQVKSITGEPIVFPCQIPDMNPLPVASEDKGNINSDVTRMIEQANNENDELRQRIERMEAALDEAMRQREGIEATV